MNAAWCWARADLLRRWSSVAVLSILLAGAFGATLALVAGARRADTAADRFAAASDLADVTVFVGGEPDQGLLDAVASDPRIVRSSRSDLTLVTPDPVVTGSDGFMLVGGPDDVAGGLGTPMLLSGRYPDPEAQDEILVNERAANALGFSAGQRTSLSGMASMEIGAQTSLGREATITGVVRLANDLVDDPATAGLFLAPSNFLGGAWRDQASPGTIIWVYLADGADPRAVSQDLSGLVAEGDVSNNVSSLQVVTRSGDLQRNALLIAAIVVGLVGGMLFGQAAARFVSIRQFDEPVLGALGLARRGRFAAAMFLLAPTIIAGAIGAAFVAVAMSPVFPGGQTRRADPDPGVHLDAAVVLIGALAVVIVTTLIAAAVARRWVGQATGAAEKPAAIPTALAALGVPPVPLTGVRFAIERGGGRARPPTRGTAVVVVAAVLVVVGALVVRSSLDGLRSHPARYGQAWAMTIGGDDMRVLADRVSKDPRVDVVDLARQGELDVTTDSGRRAQIGALGIEGFSAPPALTMLQGAAPLGIGEIALGTVTMRDLDLDVGDVVTASGPCGSQRLTVSGRVIVPLVGGDTPDEGGVVTIGTYEELCADELIADIDQNDGVLVRLRDNRDTHAVAADFGAAGLFVDITSPPSSVASLADIRDVTTIVALIVAALGVAVAAYALVLTVRRRRRELAVLRAIGMVPAQVGRVMTAQATALVLIAVAIGVPLGVVVGRAVWGTIAEPSNVLVHADIGFAVIAAPVAIALIILAISLWPSWRASRLDVAAALRDE